ncbi:mCG140705, isoform CRA_c, partial [Mus musculus]
ELRALGDEDRGDCSQGSRNLEKNNKKNECFPGKCSQGQCPIQGCGSGLLTGGMGMS